MAWDDVLTGATGENITYVEWNAMVAFVKASMVTGNITLGANYISYDGTDAGLSLDSDNNATLSDNLSVTGTIGAAGGTLTGDLSIEKATGIATLEVKSGDDNAYIEINGFTSKKSILDWQINGSNKWSFTLDGSASNILYLYDSTGGLYPFYITPNTSIGFYQNKMLINTSGDITKIGNNSTFGLYGSGTYPTVQLDTGDWIRLNSDVLEFGIGGSVEASLSATAFDTKENLFYSRYLISKTANLEIKTDSGNSNGIYLGTRKADGTTLQYLVTLNGGANTPDLDIQNCIVDYNGVATKDIGDLNLNAPTELTISNGVVTVTQAYHTVDTESNDATDYLNTINGGNLGDVIIITANHTDRTIIIRNGYGNIKCAKTGDGVVLDNTEKTFHAIYDGTNWLEL